MSFTWKRCQAYDEIKTLFESVIPDEDCWDKSNMLTKYPNKFRGYTTIDGKACATVGWLSKTQTLHIDCFAIDQSIRGNGKSYEAWNTFLEFIQIEWPDVKTNKLLIEVYTKNCIVWGKVMDVINLGIDDSVVKMRVKNPVIIMGKNLNSKQEAIDAYGEWQEIEEWL